jgi:hypothetical protein
MKRILVLIIVIIFYGCFEKIYYSEDVIDLGDGLSREVKDSSLITGPIISYYDNGLVHHQYEIKVVWKKIWYEDGIENGLHLEYNKDGTTKKEGWWVNGVFEEIFSSSQKGDKRNCRNAVIMHCTNLDRSAKRNYITQFCEYNGNGVYLVQLYDVDSGRDFVFYVTVDDSCNIIKVKRV